MEHCELSLKWNHGVVSHHLGHTKLIQKGNRSREFVSAQKSKDSQLCKTSVVDFSNQSAFLLFRGLFAGNTGGIVEIKHGVNFKVLERRVLSWFAAIHVVRKGTKASRLIPPLQESNHANDLPFGGSGEGIPLFFWLQIQTRVHLSRKRDGVWKNPIGLHNVPNKGGLEKVEEKD